MYVYTCTPELCSDTWSSPLFAERDTESLEGVQVWMARRLRGMILAKGVET